LNKKLFASEQKK